jgi:hypothetical protein
MQYGGNKVTGSWTSWQVTISASPMNIAASGGSSTILCNASRTRNSLGLAFRKHLLILA